MGDAEGMPEADCGVCGMPLLDCPVLAPTGPISFVPAPTLTGARLAPGWAASPRAGGCAPAASEVLLPSKGNARVRRTSSSADGAKGMP